MEKDKFNAALKLHGQIQNLNHENKSLENIRLRFTKNGTLPDSVHHTEQFFIQVKTYGEISTYMFNTCKLSLNAALKYEEFLNTIIAENNEEIENLIKEFDSI